MPLTPTTAWRAIPDGTPRREVSWALLADLLPPGARLANPCPHCGGPHGPVRVRGADAVVSVSYAGRIAVVAVADSRSFAALGVDAELAHDARRDAAGMTGVLGAGDASVRSWTRVEAALKADGRGVRVDPASVTVRETSEGWQADVPGGGTFEGRDADGPPGALVSVAWRPVRAAPAAAHDRATL